MHIPLLPDLLILLGSSVVIVFLLHRLRLPSVIGFLATGIIIGPYSLGLIQGSEEIEILSEIGVILLLFVIGMELSIKQLASIRKTVLIGGFLQVGLTIGVAALVYRLMGYSWNTAVFIGFLFSLSSTAIVLKTFQDRNEISSAHARNALAFLIFQDIIVVPMMLLTPLLAGQTTDLGYSIAMLLIKSAVVIVITIISARYIVPRIMHSLALTNSKELFLLFTITLCFAIAFLTAQAGLSLALGAFLAGLIISESEYSHQATGVILPFRELFTSFFFISIGMLLNLNFFFSNIGVVLLMILAVFIVKSAVAALAAHVLNYPPRTVFMTGIALFQVGEFAFILSQIGLDYGLLTEQTNQYFLSVSIVSMILTPLVIFASGNITDKLLGVTGRIVRREISSVEAEDNELPEADGLDNHLVIIGYGINGRNLARAAESGNIPYAVIDMNADTVKEERAKGQPILYGDAAEEHLLHSVHVERARAVVVAISDDGATKNIIRNIRQISDSVYLVVRTRYVKEMQELRALGADEVIPEEFETSIQIFSRVMQNFLIPEDDIIHFAESVRSDNYGLFKGDKSPPRTFRPSGFPEFNITCLRITADSGRFLGKPIGELKLRTEFGITVLGISRHDKLMSNIKPTDTLRHQDLVYVQGTPEDIEVFHKEIV